ncbi:unnamed protein product [Brassica napus]|uniref:D-fructose-1,6-bisphosphate 1-phosphohydrolase n=1 Tax=Brassica napus TaxID=3708 RepID=A0A816HY46_BRANA|nr:unnamed protein product [Brassica napus]
MLNYCSDNYIVGFHLLDGSSNINAAVSTGSIFGVYSPSAGKTSAMYGEFVLTQENIEIPRAGKIYSFNEGNYQMWDESLRKYIDELNLTLVQVGNLTRQGTLEVWSETLLYSGIYGFCQEQKRNA